MAESWLCSISYKDGCSSEVVHQRMFSSEVEARFYVNSYVESLDQKNPYVVIERVIQKNGGGFRRILLRLKPDKYRHFGPDR